MTNAKSISGGFWVFDASVLLRAAIDELPAAVAALRALARRELRALAPDFIWAEVANGLVVHVRATRITLDQAAKTLADLMAMPIETHPMGAIAAAALPTALAHGLSVYDACYVVVADAAGTTLVTADRWLAERAPRAVLVD